MLALELIVLVLLVAVLQLFRQLRRAESEIGLERWLRESNGRICDHRKQYHDFRLFEIERKFVGLRDEQNQKELDLYRNVDTMLVDLKLRILRHNVAVGKAVATFINERNPSNSPRRPKKPGCPLNGAKQ